MSASDIAVALVRLIYYPFTLADSALILALYGIFLFNLAFALVTRFVRFCGVI